MSIWIKICANTSLEDALMAVDAGADAVGFVFAPSPRRVTAAEVAGIAPRLPHAVEKFGVFVDAALEEIVSAVEACGLTGVQLHYDAEPALPARLHQRLGPELRILRVIRFRAETAGLHGVQLASHARKRMQIHRRRRPEPRQCGRCHHFAAPLGRGRGLRRGSRAGPQGSRQGAGVYRPRASRRGRPMAPVTGQMNWKPPAVFTFRTPSCNT